MKTKATWSVAVVYEDAVTREAAVGFCDRLTEQFWSERGINIDWCSFAALEESQGALDSAKRVAEADLVIFATQAELPYHVRAWIDLWLDQRGRREGALVSLTFPQPALLSSCAEAQPFLRNIAHRAGMDYLTEVPQSMSQLIPEVPETYCERAQQVTSVLDEILHQPALPVSHSPWLPTE